MKQCLSCNISVGGNAETCPLCQNALEGDEVTAGNWPSMSKLKKQAFFYKLQLFIVLALCVVSLSMDFLLDLNDGRHWSLVLTFAAVVIEIMLKRFLKNSVVVAKIITISVTNAAVILLVAGWFFDFIPIVIFIIIPILLGASLIANLVFSLVDKSGNALVYLLANIFFGTVMYIGLAIGRLNRTLPWTICLMISAVTFLGIVIFKGKKVVHEVQKRMNI